MWVFGDSYAVHCPRLPWSWVESVRSRLGNIDISANAVYGSSLDWTYHRFEISRKAIEPGDIILVVLTALDRRWFFRDKPQISAAATIFASGAGNQIPHKDAIRSYYTHLDDPYQHALHLANWLDVLDSFSEKNGNRCLVIPAFDDSRKILESESCTWPDERVVGGMPKPTGTFATSLTGRARWQSLAIPDGRDLYSIYQAEMSPALQLSPADDKRTNHICRDNHEILSDKIYQWIRTGEPVHLEGFRTGILTNEVIGIENWYDKKIITS